MITCYSECRRSLRHCRLLTAGSADSLVRARFIPGRALVERILCRVGRFRSKEAPYSRTHSHMLDGERKVVS